MWASVSNFLGNQPVDLYAPTTTQQHALGQVIDAVDPTFFGQGRFIYGKAAAAINNGRLSYFTAAHVATDYPNTANLGGAVVVSAAVMAISTYGWFQVAGQIPVQTAASVAIGVAVGIGAAGQAGTNAAGKQLLGARVVQASTYAPTKTIRTQNGSKVIQCTDVSGLIPGLAVTGTGVGASAVIVSVDSSQHAILVDVASTATASVTGTFTWTGFLLLWAPAGIVAQGAIT